MSTAGDKEARSWETLLVTGQFRAGWERARHGRMRLLTPLPRRVRLRLAVTGAADRVAIWLCGRGLYGTAERLWRACGAWKR